MIINSSKNINQNMFRYDMSLTIDVIDIFSSEETQKLLEVFCHNHSVDATVYPGQRKQDQTVYDVFYNNVIYRFNMCNNETDKVYRVMINDPSIALLNALNYIFDKTDTYSLYRIEYSFDLSCINGDSAIALHSFINNSLHLSYQKKKSVELLQFSTRYINNPRVTHSRATRLYYKDDCSTIVRLEFILKYSQIDRLNLIEPLDCFWVRPLDIIENSSFRDFEQSKIKKHLFIKYKRNVASRRYNEGIRLLNTYGQMRAYMYYSQYCNNMLNNYTIVSPFNEIFRQSIGDMQFYDELELDLLEDKKYLFVGGSENYLIISKCASKIDSDDLGVSRYG